MSQNNNFIEKVAYCYETKRLQIKFQGEDEILEYVSVEPETFTNAPLGRGFVGYYFATLRGKYLAMRKAAILFGSSD